MNRKAISNGAGCLSIACSLAFWTWAALFLFTPLNRSQAWLSLGTATGSPYVWLSLWIVGLVLAVLAAVLGSRKWIAAAVLALASFAAAAWLVSTMQW